LHSLKERGLAVSKDEGQWEITDEGGEWLESGGGKGKRKERNLVTDTSSPTGWRALGVTLRVWREL